MGVVIFAGYVLEHTVDVRHYAKLQSRRAVLLASITLCLTSCSSPADSGRAYYTTSNPSPPQVGQARLAHSYMKPGQARVSWGKGGRPSLYH